MNSITATYPGFQSLPKGIKQMLVVSESLFFEESKTSAQVFISRHQPDATTSTHAGQETSSPSAALLADTPAIEPWTVPAATLAKAAIASASH
jgi:hypothetical protein